MGMSPAEEQKIEKLIKDGNESLKELIKALLDPIQENQKVHSEQIVKIPLLEQKLKDHLDNHTTNSNSIKWRVEIWVGIIIFTASQIISYLKP